MCSMQLLPNVGRGREFDRSLQNRDELVGSEMHARWPTIITRMSILVMSHIPGFMGALAPVPRDEHPDYNCLLTKLYFVEVREPRTAPMRIKHFCMHATFEPFRASPSAAVRNLRYVYVKSPEEFIGAVTTTGLCGNKSFLADSSAEMGPDAFFVFSILYPPPPSI